MVIVIASYPDKNFFRSGNYIKTRISYSLWGTYGVIILFTVLQKRRSNRDDLGFVISIETYFVTHQWNHFAEAVLMRGHNISFH